MVSFVIYWGIAPGEGGHQDFLYIGPEFLVLRPCSCPFSPPDTGVFPCLFMFLTVSISISQIHVHGFVPDLFGRLGIGQVRTDLLFMPIGQKGGLAGAMHNLIK